MGLTITRQLYYKNLSYIGDQREKRSRERGFAGIKLKRGRVDEAPLAYGQEQRLESASKDEQRVVVRILPKGGGIILHSTKEVAEHMNTFCVDCGGWTGR